MRQISKYNPSPFVLRKYMQFMCSLSLIIGAWSFAPLFAQAQAEGDQLPTTFLVVRHAERDGDMDKLTQAGEDRAQLLASLGVALKVRHIYSTDTQRTKGTAQPLATALRTDIAIYGQPSDDWIASLKQKHAGQVVLIVGHSNTAGVIAGLLANTEAFVIEHDEYDALFIIQTTESAKHVLRLKYGNDSDGASAAAPEEMGELETTPDSNE